MTDVFPTFQPPPRAVTPNKIEWFEFLLNVDLLEEHLSQESPEPTGPELAVTFLRQSQVAIQVAKNIQAAQQQQQAQNPTGPPITPGAGDPQQADDKQFENKRSKALKTLALRTLAFLKWDLSALNKAPLAVIHEILQEFLRKTLPEDLQESRHSDLHLSSLPDEVIFALQLYHRWCIRTVVRDSFPKKPLKMLNVPVPGLVDPNTATNGENGQFLDMVRETTATISVTILEGLLGVSRDFKMPTAKCFALTTDGDTVEQDDWSLGEKILFNEMACQISYDLGAHFMLTGQYSKAKDNFIVANDLYKKLKDMKYCQINEPRLLGYLQACNIHPAQLTLHDKLNRAKADYKNVKELFQEDNEKRELTLQSRLALEDQLKALGKCSKEDLFAVSAVNIVRRIQDDIVCPAEFLSQINDANVGIVLKLCDAVVDKGSYTQKANIKAFIRNLCCKLPQNTEAKRMMKKYLTTEEIREVESNQQNSQKLANLSPNFEKENLEVLLRDTYDVNAIKSTVDKYLKDKVSKQGIISLSQVWYLPKDIYSYLEKIHTSHNSARIQTQILIAKARTALNLQNFDKARELLSVADGLVTDLSYNVSKLLRWEVLFTDLTQFLETGKTPHNVTTQDMTKKVKLCMSSLQVEHDVQPRPDVICSCVAYLLSVKEWSYLTGVTNNQNGYVCVGRLIASLCQELPTIKTARKAAREFWEAVLLIFTVSNQQKRTNSGAANIIQRETCLGFLLPQYFNALCRKIRETTALSAIISCLTKLYCTLQDDITIDIFSEYLILWPTAVSSSGSVNITAVQDSALDLLDEGLRLTPTQVSWLRTRADFSYAHNQYTTAMKGYLQAGVVATEFFSEAVPRAVYDDQIYKRMIKCCSYLQCYTQVAVLCQFLDEVDYPTAFKAFQEKNSHDALDTYYSCIWDVTMLEYLINLHHRRGELDKKQFVMRLISKLELNSSNPAEILVEAAKTRKTQFLRALARQYL